METPEKYIRTDLNGFTYYSGISIVGFGAVIASLVQINNFQESQRQSKFTIKTKNFACISQPQWASIIRQESN